ncbi:MAG: TerB family tellurite resistance protein [Emcibacter sp.]|nr:TerB family tellurite resistance protein [Emcibacter sp.]
MSILKRLGNMLKEKPVQEEQKRENEKLAAAVLMVEVAANDGQISRIEREHILYLLENKLGLSEAEALELFVEALATQNDSHHILSFTRKIKDHFDEAGREQILELMWEVVFADGKEDLYESNLLRRVTGLLYVSDKKNGQIRKKVMASLK